MSDPILDALKTGAKTYGQLPQLPNLDFVLRNLLKSRKIAMFHYECRPTVYSLPLPPDEEPKGGYSRTLHLPKVPVKNPRKPRRKCGHCGTPCHRPEAKYCSAECVVLSRTKPRPNCLRCGKPTNAPESKYCSRECANYKRLPVDILAVSRSTNLFLNCGDCGLDQGWADGACPRCGKMP